MDRQPAWVLRLVAGLIEHEETHSAGDMGCVAGLLEQVPADVRTYAEGWAAGAKHTRQLAETS